MVLAIRFPNNLFAFKLRIEAPSFQLFINTSGQAIYKLPADQNN